MPEEKTRVRLASMILSPIVAGVVLTACSYDNGSDKAVKAQSTQVQQAIATSIARESALTAGSVELALEVTPAGRAFRPRPMPERFAAGGTLRYQWEGDAKWHVTFKDCQGRTVSDVFCDGEWIYTEDAVWDVRFLTGKVDEYPEEPDGDSESGGFDKIEGAFRDGIWPFEAAAKGHLFPLSIGRTDFAFLPMFAQVATRLSAAECRQDPSSPVLSVDILLPSSGPGVVVYPNRFAAFVDSLLPNRLKAVPRPKPDVMSLDFDTAHGNMTLRWDFSPAALPQAPLDTWEQPLEVEGGVYVPLRHSGLLNDGSGTVLFSTTLCLETSAFSSSSLPDFPDLSVPESGSGKPRYRWRVSPADDEHSF